MGNTCGCINRIEDIPNTQSRYLTVSTFMSQISSDSVIRKASSRDLSPQMSPRFLTPTEVSEIQKRTSVVPTDVEYSISRSIINAYPNISLLEASHVLSLSVLMPTPIIRGQEYMEAEHLGAQACVLIVALLDCSKLSIRKMWRRNIKYKITDSLKENLDIIVWSLIATEKIFSLSRTLVFINDLEPTAQSNLKSVVSLLDNENEFVKFWAFKTLFTILEATHKNIDSFIKNYYKHLSQIFANLESLKSEHLLSAYIETLISFVETLSSDDLENFEQSLTESILKAIEVLYKQNLKKWEKADLIKEAMLKLVRLKENVRSMIIKIFYNEHRIFNE